MDQPAGLAGATARFATTGSAPPGAGWATAFWFDTFGARSAPPEERSPPPWEPESPPDGLGPRGAEFRMPSDWPPPPLEPPPEVPRVPLELRCSPPLEGPLSWRCFGGEAGFWAGAAGFSTGAWLAGADYWTGADFWIGACFSTGGACFSTRGACLTGGSCLTGGAELSAGADLSTGTAGLTM